MRLSNSGVDRLEDPYGEIVVVFNASSEERALKVDELKDLPFDCIRFRPRRKMRL